MLAESAINLRVANFHEAEITSHIRWSVDDERHSFSTSPSNHGGDDRRRAHRAELSLRPPILQLSWATREETFKSHRSHGTLLSRPVKSRLCTYSREISFVHVHVPLRPMAHLTNSRNIPTPSRVASSSSFSTYGSSPSMDGSSALG